MKATKITDSEIEACAIASLPTRPTAPTAFGGRGYTATEMKEAFDKLPCLIAERLNALLEDISDGSIAAAMPTNIDDDIQTLADLYLSIQNGAILNRIIVYGLPLPSLLAKMQNSINIIARKVGLTITEVDE